MFNLDKLLSIRANAAIETVEEFPGLFFDYAGIIPAKAASYQYEVTPLNTTVFAATGGDGVHYSVLQISERINPVVMTVPMNLIGSIRERNIIIGENLAEFLSIGYFMGWFYLEQLCYDFERTIALYSQKATDQDYLSEVDARFVRKLMEKLGLEHVPLQAERLKELEGLYFERLEFG